MTWEEIVAGCLAVGFALAFSTGLARRAYQGFLGQFWKKSFGLNHEIYVEVWDCPRCHWLNPIGQACKQCGGRMPLQPRFKTVPESHLTKHLQPSHHSDRNQAR